MATFKIGQKVKVDAPASRGIFGEFPAVRETGVIDMLPFHSAFPNHYGVVLDCPTCVKGIVTRDVMVHKDYIKPLIDPDALSFIEKMNKLTPTDLVRLQEEDYLQEKEIL